MLVNNLEVRKKRRILRASNKPRSRRTKNGATDLELLRFHFGSFLVRGCVVLCVEVHSCTGSYNSVVSRQDAAGNRSVSVWNALDVSMCWHYYYGSVVPVSKTSMS